MYDSVMSTIYSILVFWVVFLVFQRINTRYPKSNPWKKDILLTFIQSVIIVLLVLPILALFIN
ncbi:hypothetical protein [Litchfieldia alkalitelluris]|uniref:hypothetical protein n=1 Tax=Litchfieldia alkalitelluris TaxID=304268 RepID=UPI0009983564|nr:hypothetical protein [Litchfieldia alkalitelluris]